MLLYFANQRVSHNKGMLRIVFRRKVLSVKMLMISFVVPMAFRTSLAQFKSLITKFNTWLAQ